MTNLDDDKLNISDETSLDTSSSRIGYLKNVFNEKSKKFKNKIRKKNQDFDTDIFIVFIMILFYICTLYTLAINFLDAKFLFNLIVSVLM